MILCKSISGEFLIERVLTCLISRSRPVTSFFSRSRLKSAVGRADGSRSQVFDSGQSGCLRDYSLARSSFPFSPAAIVLSLSFLRR